MPISQEKVTKILDLNLKDLSPESKIEAKEVAADIIIEEINSYLDDSKSPVASGRFKKKKADGSSSQLFQDGDLRMSIEAQDAGGDSIEIGVFDSSEAPIAYNHNTGDTLPMRQFIPPESKGFRRAIMRKVNDAIDDIRATQDDEGIQDILANLDQITITPETSIGDLFSTFVFGASDE